MRDLTAVMQQMVDTMRKVFEELDLEDLEPLLIAKLSVLILPLHLDQLGAELIEIGAHHPPLLIAHASRRVPVRSPVAWDPEASWPQTGRPEPTCH